MNKGNFIMVADTDTADELKKLGYELVYASYSEESNLGNFIFMNNTNLKFSENINMHKICYTNKLFV